MKTVNFFVKKRDYLYIFLITLGSIIYSGYFVAYADDQLFLPALLQRINPGLYPNDYVNFEPLRTLTLFTDIQFFFYHLFSKNLIWMLFFLYAIGKFLIYTGVYSLSMTLFRSRLAAFFAVATLFLPISLGRTGISTIELSLIPRILALGPALLFLNALLQSRFTLSATLFSVVFLIHPVTAFHIGIMGFIFIAVFRKEVTKFSALRTLSILCVSLIVLLGRYLLTKQSYNLPLWSMSDEWKELFTYRARYLFLNLWKLENWYHLLRLTTPLIIFLAIAKRAHCLSTKKYIGITLFCLGVIINLAISYVFLNLDLRIIPLIMRLEPARAILYWVYLGFIGFAGLIITMSQRTSSPITLFFAIASLLALPRMNYTAFLGWFLLWGVSMTPRIQQLFRRLSLPILIASVIVSWLLLKHFSQPDWILYLYIPLIAAQVIKREEALALTAIVALTINAGISHVKSNFPPDIYYGGVNRSKIYWREYLQQKVHFPKLPATDWLEAQHWIGNNTSETTIVLAPGFFQPGDLTGFRAFSFRSVAYDFKDGGLGTYSERHALEWLRRYKDLEGNEKFTAEKLLELQKIYHFDYIVRSAVDPQLTFPVVFQNTWVTIYHIKDDS